jgi:hypothetical protein
MAGPATAQDVQVDYDRSTDFSKYHTFVSGVESQWSNPLAEQRVIAAVDSALTSKGWTKGTSQDSVDALVVVNGATKNQQELTTFYDGPAWGGYRWGGVGTTATTTVSNYPVGTLLVDVFDRGKKQVVWRGVAQGELSDNPEKQTKGEYKAVAKMFKNFPPPPAGAKKN